MKLFKQIISFFLLISVISSYGQELPPIKQYLPTDYNAESQNWSISQSKDNYIYVANNIGLLEFNGATWQVYPTPNETIMRSVLAVEDRVYSGFYMDFGYWKRNTKGALKYTSIAKKNKIPLIEDEQFWNIIQLNEWVLFQSLQRIYLYNINTKEYTFVQTDTSIVKMIELEGTVYFQQTAKGVFKLENGKPKLVSDDNILKNNRIVNVYRKEDNLLFLTEDKGFYSLSKSGLKPWNNKVNKLISNQTIYSSIQLKNEDFLLGTISNGLISLSKNNTVKYQVNQQNGLSNNTILSIFEDKDKLIWLGLDSGINTINPESKYKIYTDKTGELGTVYASILFNEYLYLGTNQGLFYKKFNSKDNFKFIKNTQGQVWCLKEIDDVLFCGHNSGTYIINTNIATKIADIEGTWDLKKINKNTLIQGNYNGLNILKKNNNVWKFNNKIEGFDASSKDFVLLDSKRILVSHGYKGVYNITIDNSYKKVKEIFKDTTLQRGIYSGIVKYQNDILYAFKKGIYKYDIKLNKFKKDTTYSGLFTEKNYASGRLIVDNNLNKLWAFTKTGINYSVPGKLSSLPIIHYNYLSENLRKGAKGFENISFLKENKYLLGISNGYIILNENINEKQKDFLIDITAVKSYTLNNKEENLNLNVESILENNNNNVEISYTTPVYNNFGEVLYQYKLEGHNNIWSSWTNKNKELFENLSYGDYTFITQSKVGNQLSTNKATYTFSIKKPWYFSDAMIFLYCLGLVIVYLIIHMMYTRYYKKQQKEVLKRKQREFELTTLESEKQIMRIKNDQLTADIESKNRELASSTMSIIRKNEFLNTIKKELKEETDGKNTNKNVIKIIDKNLNNTDDWQLFKEAFNNADKGFIKKVKSLHPSLTPNDLRLCAYLRLNLSSKEIAPLLNISPRSVEIKRYRLRKKMNLAPKTNLTSYILEV